MKKRLFVVLLAFACLISVSASLQTKRVLIDYQAITNYGENDNRGHTFQPYSPEDADSIFRFTLLGCNGRVRSVPTIAPSTDPRPGTMWMKPGNSLKIDASRTGSATTSRVVTKVEVQMAASSYANASQVSAYMGSVTFNNSTTTPIVTWT
ncbi:MAG: hypothetical protein IKI07_05810, partial [Prevotella sp.]|nr:hypothetical protein [Prevotella sp.]